MRGIKIADCCLVAGCKREGREGQVGQEINKQMIDLVILNEIGREKGQGEGTGRREREKGQGEGRGRRDREKGEGRE
jgi:hypothetical protein